ncbi:hypothetical protein MMC14_008130 [Varicellaria rhodocarpa]|nr:hypothetical protein [Varicellaria rhodocarpa]
MPSRSPSRGRTRTRSPEPRVHSPTPSVSRSPRRSVSPRSRSPSRTPSDRARFSRRNGRGRSPSRSPSRSGSRGARRYRDRSFSRSPTKEPAAPKSSKIVVEKLTKNVNEGHLREIFGAYGPIKEVDLPINRQFMTNRGTAYILFNSSPPAESAIAHMHEAQLDGTTIHLAEEVPPLLSATTPAHLLSKTPIVLPVPLRQTTILDLVATTALLTRQCAVDLHHRAAVMVEDAWEGEDLETIRIHIVQGDQGRGLGPHGQDHDRITLRDQGVLRGEVPGPEVGEAVRRHHHLGAEDGVEAEVEEADEGEAQVIVATAAAVAVGVGVEVGMVGGGKG